MECVALGAGLMGSGGGGDPNLGRIIALKKLRQGKQIRVVNPARSVESSYSSKDRNVLLKMYEV